jgi:hypothetical protein
MRGEPVELNCPFCDKGKIQCWYIPGAWIEKHHTIRKRVTVFVMYVVNIEAYVVCGPYAICLTD